MTKDIKWEVMDVYDACLFFTKTVAGHRIGFLCVFTVKQQFAEARNITSAQPNVPKFYDCVHFHDYRHPPDTFTLEQA